MAPEQDVITLLTTYLINLGPGVVLSFSLFKDTWGALKFSELLLAEAAGGASQDVHMQQLFDVALTCCTSATAFTVTHSTLSSLANLALQEIGGQQEQIHGWTQSNFEEFQLKFQASSLFCLYCLYFAQPAWVTTRIRLTPEHCQTLLELLPLLRQAACKDALQAIKRLSEANGFVLAASHSSVDYADGSQGGGIGTLAPGMGVVDLSAGLNGAEAATCRELKFHLSSTLPGLGSSNIEKLCSKYQACLSRVWQTSGGGESLVSGDIEVPKGVADLELGRVVHDYIQGSAQHAQSLLKGVQPEPAAGAADEEESEAPRGTGGRERTVEPPGVAEVGGQGLPAAAKRVMLRDQARKLDIRRRADTWARKLGVQPIEGSSAPAIEYVDMPELTELAKQNKKK